MAAETEEVSNAEITEAPGSTNGMGHNSFRDESATQASSLTASQQNSDDEYEGSHHSESTWLSRAQSRTEELRKLFHLPPGEVMHLYTAFGDAGITHLQSVSTCSCVTRP